MALIKVMVLADSLAMPRKVDGETVLWEETWPFLLGQKFADLSNSIKVINMGKRARNSFSLVGYEFTENVEFIEPDICIIQVGVVDSMPRVFTKIEKKIMNLWLFPNVLKSRLIQRRSKNRAKFIGSNPIKNTEVSPSNFRSYMLEFVIKCQKQPKQPILIFVPILISKQKMEEKSPGSWSNACLYNSILEEIANDHKSKFLSPTDYYSRCEGVTPFLSDGYHLSKDGNKILSDCLELSLRQLIIEKWPIM